MRTIENTWVQVFSLIFTFFQEDCVLPDEIGGWVWLVIGLTSVSWTFLSQKRLSKNDTPFLDGPSGMEDFFNGGRVEAVFSVKNALSESFLSIRILGQNGGLGNDGAVIEFFIHKMNGTARHFDTIFKCLGLGV